MAWKWPSGGEHNGASSEEWTGFIDQGVTLEGTLTVKGTFRIDGNVLSIAKDPASPKVPGDGTFRAINGTVSSGPSDNWLTPDGEYLYQIYGNASKLVGYATKPDGSLEEVTSVTIPYNSPEGLAGF